MASTFIAIQTITTSSSPASVTFSSIPQTYKHLCLISNINNTDSNQIRMFFNSSTSNFYRYGEMNFSGTSTPRQYRGSVTSFSLGNSEVWTSNMSAMEIWIPNYVSTDISKSYLYRCTAMDASSLGSNTGTYGGGQWDTVDAITSIQIKPDSGTINNGSNFTLYGLA